MGGASSGRAASSGWRRILALCPLLPVAAGAATEFSIVVLPDTQNYAQSFPAIFDSQTQWIVDNKNALGIVYVAHLGDCVQEGDNGGDPAEWREAEEALSLLEDPVTTSLSDGIPYGIAVGNHDQSPFGDPGPGTTVFYNQFFGESRFLGRGYYGGHYAGDNDNHVDFFSALGMDFIVIYLEYDSSQDAGPLAWADALLTLHPDRRAIVVSHFVLTGSGDFGNQGGDIYDGLRHHPNLFLMLGGHRSAEARRADVFGGNTVNSLLSNYQNRSMGGSGWLRIMQFDAANDEIRVSTYSPWLSQFESDADSEFTLAYDLELTPSSVPLLPLWASPLLGVALACSGGVALRRVLSRPR